MKRFLIGMMLVGSSYLLIAQEYQRIATVEEAIELAKANNTDLQIFQLQVEQARIEMKSAKQHRLPTISASFAGQNNRSLPTTPLPGEIFGQPGEVVDAQFGQQYNYNAGITVSKSILNRGNQVQSKMAETELELQTAKQGAYQQSLVQQTAQYYYGLLVTMEAVRLGQKDVTLTDSLIVLSKQKRDQGLIGQMGLIQAQILANRAKEQLNSTLTRQLDYEMQLKILLGLPITSGVTLEEVIGEKPLNDVHFELGYNRELKAPEIESRLARLRVKKQKTAFLPQLGFDSYFGQQQFRNDFGLSMDADNWSAYSYLGLSVHVPLFTGFKNKQQLKGARIAQQIAEQKLTSSQVNAEFQDKMHLQNFISSKDRLNYTQENFELYQVHVRLSLQQYEKGLIGLDAHLSAMEDLIKAEQQYLDALNAMYGHYATLLSRQEP